MKDTVCVGRVLASADETSKRDPVNDLIDSSVGGSTDHDSFDVICAEEHRHDACDGMGLASSRRSLDEHDVVLWHFDHFLEDYELGRVEEFSVGLDVPTHLD